MFISYTPADERWASWLAWELESAGYRTMMQAWDFVPGSNFVDFIDVGVSEAALVIAVLSQNYLKSRWGRLEWQTALRAEPDPARSKLVPVRIEECELDGLLALITFVDLVGVRDPAVARARLLARIAEALRGRGKPPDPPGYPLAEGPPGPAPDSAPFLPLAGASARRRPGRAPEFPPAAAGGPRSAVTVLHVSSPRISRHTDEPGASAGTLQARIWGEVTRLVHAGAPRPDLLVLSGDITAAGHPREYETALVFLAGLRALLGLEPHRVVLVPGPGDVNQAACRAYFQNCEADDIEPEPPYWQKWRHFARFFKDFYDGVDGVLFDSVQPWSVFRIPDLQVVVAGLNSTMAFSHREEDQYGFLGEAQAAWFAHHLRPLEEAGWLRIGAVHHSPGYQPSGYQPPGQAAPAADSGVLRDTATFDRLLAGRLNLLLPGSTPAGPEEPLGASPGEPLVVPAPRGVGVQLLTLDAGGATVWTEAPRTGTATGEAAAGEAAPVSRTRVSRTWHATSATFRSALPAGAPAGGPAVPDAPSLGAPSGGDLGGLPVADGRQADPLTAHLQRIADVCAVRFPGASIRLVGGRPPHLLVTYSEYGYARQLRVGGHLGPLTRADVDAFVQHVHAFEPDVTSELVTDVPPPPALREEALRRRVRVRTFTEFQGLLDLGDFVAEQTARLREDLRYPPSLYVPQRYRDLVGADRSIRHDLVEELLRLCGEEDGRFVLVLGDFGRGKTFALREVARRLPERHPALIPIFIELRNLDKAHNVNGLVAAHLATNGRDLIDMKAFRYMLEQGRIVLLFDGFDELVARATYDRAADHLETLLQAARGDAKIIVASRTQHFRTNRQVLTALGERVGLLPQRRVLNIEDFEPSQVRSYLVNRYGGPQAADERLRLIENVQDLRGLAANPRMLSFIAELPPERLTAAASDRGPMSAAGLYREILNSWLHGEVERAQGVRGTPATLSFDELWAAVTMLALRLWESDEPFLRLAEIGEVAETLSKLTEVRLSTPQAAHAMGAGSLLARTDEGLFGFIHSSVAEWLVAAEIARRFESQEAPQLLARRQLSQLSVDFLCDLAPAEACRNWADKVLNTPDADEVTRANALKVAARLGAPLNNDLRGISLRGEDLSYREMRGVDLTGADLTDARLVGADLSGAVLRDARLVGARLDDADLTDADLSGADLLRARMLGVTLTGVVDDGARVSRAAVIAATGDAALLEGMRRRGAAVAPGQPVDVGLAPTDVGVSFGFEVGRLPHPVTYTGDGEVLAAANDDGSIVTWDSTTGRPVRTLHGHRDRAYVLQFAGGVLLSGAADRTVRLWDPATGRRLHVLRGHEGWVWPVQVSPDGRLAAVGDAAGTVRLWHIPTGRLELLLPGHATRVWTAAFTPGGDVLVTGDDLGAVRLWDTRTGELLRTIPGAQPVYRVAVSPDGDLIAAAGNDACIRLWDRTGARLLASLPAGENALYTLDFSPDGRLLASGDTGGVVRLWELDQVRAARPAAAEAGQAEGTVVEAVPSRVVARHRGAIYQVRFSPDGASLASCGSDSLLRLVDVATGELRHEFTGHRSSVWPAEFRPDGGQIATGSNDGSVRLWDPATGACQHTLTGLGRKLNGVRFSPDGRLLATSGTDGAVRLWDPRTGLYRGVLGGVSDRLLSVLFSPDGQRVAAPGSGGSVHLWNLAQAPDDRPGSVYERELKVETEHVWAAAFDPRGDVLATANDDDSVRLWYRATGRRALIIPDHRGRVRSVAFSPDGTMLATGCDDRLVRVWDAETGQALRVLPGHGDRVHSVVFSPDGQWLASASNDGTARVWDAASGEPVTVFTEHEGRLWAAAVSPDGAVLATAGDDLVVRLWEPATGQVLATLSGHTRRILSLDFSPDGSRLASCGDDGTVRLWDVSQWGRAGVAVTLVGHDAGWAALAPDGGYKIGGDIAGEVWHAIGACRFELGELDDYLDAVRRLPDDAGF